MKIYKPLFLMAGLLFFSINNTQANDCRGYGTLADEFKSSAAIFSGKVIAQEYKRVKNTLYSDDVVFEVLQVRFKVERWWKGSGDAEVIVRPGGARVSGHSLRGGDDFRFTFDKSYLVYTGNSQDPLRTSDCSRTKTLDSSEEDLQMLGEGFLPRSVIDSNSSEHTNNLLPGNLNILFQKLLFTSQ